MLLLVAFGTSSYILTRHILLSELDEALDNARIKIVAYVHQHKVLPPAHGFDDLRIHIDSTSHPLTSPAYESTERYITDEGRPHFARSLKFFVSVDGKNYQVMLSKPLEGVKHIVVMIVATTSVMIFLLVLLLLLTNRLFMANLWKPFYQSLESVKDFKVHAAQQVVFPETRVQEFNIMNQHFQQAANNAQREYKSLKEFSESAAHELQTPLAIIRSKLDILIQQDNFTEEQINLLKETYGSISKLSKLNHSLLLLTKIENNQYNTESGIDFKEKLEYKISQFQEIWENSQLECASQLEEAYITANPDLIEIFLNNVLSNATRHNYPGGHISIELNSKELKVTNSGMRQPLEKDKLFKRFYKATTHAEDNGLGLSIVKQICERAGMFAAYHYRYGTHQFVFTW